VGGYARVAGEQPAGAGRHFTLTSFLRLRTHFGCGVVNIWGQAV
jgi:hypothetical protein